MGYETAVALAYLAGVARSAIGLAKLASPAIGFAWNADTIAHMISVASPAATSYVLHKRFAFRSPRCS